MSAWTNAQQVLQGTTPVFLVTVAVLAMAIVGFGPIVGRNLPRGVSTSALGKQQRTATFAESVCKSTPSTEW